MTYAILAFAALSLAGAVSGWFYAWRARGDANTAAERARFAEAKADAAAGRAFVSEANASIAISQHKALELTIADYRQQLARVRAEKADLLEQVAKLGVPVGDALFDSTTDRLYKDRTRRETGGGQSPGTGGSSDGVPVIVARDPGKTGTG